MSVEDTIKLKNEEACLRQGLEKTEGNTERWKPMNGQEKKLRWRGPYMKKVMENFLKIEMPKDYFKTLEFTFKLFPLSRPITPSHTSSVLQFLQRPFW